MKQNPLNRVLLCLAALNLSSNELQKALYDLKRLSIDEVAEIVRDFQLGYRIEKYDTPSLLSSKSNSSDIAERVEYLLKNEAQMSSSELALILAKQLTAMKMIRRNELPEFSPKRGVRNWITKLATLVPEKEILRCATLIRNERVHSPAQDWTFMRHET